MTLTTLLAEVERLKRVLSRYSPTISDIAKPILDVCDQLAALAGQLEGDKLEAERWAQTLINQADRNQLAKDDARLNESNEEIALITTLSAQLSAAQRRVEELVGKLSNRITS